MLHIPPKSTKPTHYSSWSRTFSTPLCLVVLLAILSSESPLGAQRQMEDLGRGVVAVRKNSNEAFVSWRLLGLDPAGIAFNLYRSENGGDWTRLNGRPLNRGTNYTDGTANFSVSNSYRVAAVIDGVEQSPSAAWTLPANTASEPLFRIQLQKPGERVARHVWVGDLDGDGEYEFIVSWNATVTGLPQMLQAYKRDGTLLWELDCGPNGVNPDGNYYAGAANITTGQWDGVTVYDMDGSGRAEVMIITANGVTFGDGESLTYSGGITQFISVLDGETGAEKARIPFPNPWMESGRPLRTLLGIGYPDGERPSLMIHAKSRRTTGEFNVIQSAWDYREGVLSQRWSIEWDGESPANPTVAHNMRMIDVTGDGRDEMVPGMHVINFDGTLRYDLGDQGIVHGDRFHIGDFDPSRPGLEGYGIQQNHPDNLMEYYFDPATGEILWTVVTETGGDAARGTVANIDPNHPGMQFWSFDGIRTVEGTLISDNHPWPNLQIWWDGDLTGENLHDRRVEKWNPATQSVTRLLSAWNYGASSNTRDVPLFYGDILGDWREEMIFHANDSTELLVFTTTYPTEERIYTLAHNPAYRNCLTHKGYVQQNTLDFYLGHGMSTPPQPNIVYVPLQDPPSDPTPPSAPTGLAATGNFGQIVLDWDDNTESDFAGYSVKRATTAGGPYHTLAKGHGPSTYADTNVETGATYYYVVSAFDTSLNESLDSGEVSATPPSLFANSSTLSGSGASSATISDFDLSGGNTLVVLVSTEGLGTSPSYTATYGGDNITNDVTVDYGFQGAAVFYAIDPTVTSGDVVVTFGPDSIYTISAISLNDVTSVNDSDFFAQDAGSGSVTLSYDGTADGIMVAAMTDNGWNNNLPRIWGDNTSEYLARVAGTRDIHAGRAQAFGLLSGYENFSETFTWGDRSSSRNVGVLMAFAVASDTSPLHWWLVEKFGSDADQPVAAWDAAPAGDGVANRLKYAFDLEPFVPSRSRLPSLRTVSEDDEGEKFAFSFRRPEGREDLSYHVEYTSDLAAEWDEVEMEDLPTTWTVDPDGTPVVNVEIGDAEGKHRSFWRVRLSVISEQED